MNADVFPNPPVDSETNRTIVDLVAKMLKKKTQQAHCSRSWRTSAAMSATSLVLFLFFTTSWSHFFFFFFLGEGGGGECCWLWQRIDPLESTFTLHGLRLSSKSFPETGVTPKSMPFLNIVLQPLFTIHSWYLAKLTRLLTTQDPWEKSSPSLSPEKVHLWCTTMHAYMSHLRQSRSRHS